MTDPAPQPRQHDLFADECWCKAERMQDITPKETR